VEEIGEVLTHTGVYAGVPVSNQALKIARAVLTEDGLLE
jgi:alkylhydroperoxidase/carboxymuconolactone decarboxylase family protein YurZ